MSVRLEWATAADPFNRPEVYERGNEMADGQAVTADAALAIGPLVIEGTVEELRALVTEAADLLWPPGVGLRGGSA